MKARRVYGLIVMLLVFGFTAQTQAVTVTDQQIQDGIRKLVEQLYSLQNANGIWEADKPENDIGHQGAQHGGRTALAVYALISAGESYQNPKLAPAIQWLSELEMKGTYAVGVRAHVWSHLPERFMPNLREDVYWLLEAIHKVDTGGKGFRYLQDEKSWDNSVNQYGLLGLWEGNKRGVPVGTKEWEEMEKHFLAVQHADGGWSYNKDLHPEPAGSMTTAGLACLYVTQEYVHLQDYKAPGAARTHAIQERIDSGLKWMGEKFVPNQNPGRGASQLYYYLYGVERVGLASGIKYFNGREWFAEGADQILKANLNDVVNASFGLLFLVRGGRPVFINKLEIPGYDWNNRPRDVAHLNEWVSDEMEKEMNWQRIPISAPAEAWMDAPILYLASHEPLPLDDAQKQKIKRYIDLGGLLVTTADEGSQKFTQSIKDLMKELYPDYAFKKLKPEDDLLNTVFRLQASRVPAETIHNGIRHLVIHFPKDISWALHTSSQADPSLWKFFANTFYYATEGNPRARMASHLQAKAGAAGSRVTVGRVKHGGNWNPEPMAWEVQKNFMAAKAQVELREVELSALSGDVSLAHMVDTGAKEFSEAEISSVKTYVEGGGVIFFENAGGRSAFAESVQGMLSKAFPDARFKKVSLSSPLIAGESIGGFGATQVDYRLYTLLRMGKITTPRLLVMEINGKEAVILSGDDMTEAMLNQPVWGVFGYNGESAQRLMTNIALHASKMNGR